MGESRAESKPFDEAKAAAQRMEDEEVTAAMLSCFIVDNADLRPSRLVTGRPCWGHLKSCSTAFREDDPNATEFIRELAKATPQDLGEGRLGAWGGLSLLSAPLLQVCRSSTS